MLRYRNDLCVILKVSNRQELLVDVITCALNTCLFAWVGILNILRNRRSLVAWFHHYNFNFFFRERALSSQGETCSNGRAQFQHKWGPLPSTSHRGCCIDIRKFTAARIVFIEVRLLENCVLIFLACFHAKSTHKFT